MKFYELTWGVYPRRVIIYMAEKGIADIERVPLDFLRGENRQTEHLFRNPAGTVPVLEISPGIYVRQSTAILEYLEEVYPRPNMIGETPEARASTRDLMSLINESTQFFGAYVMHSNPLFAGQIEQKHEAANIAWDLYQRRMTVLDQMVRSDEFLNGLHPTIADCSLASLVGFARDLYNLELPPACRRISEWYARFSMRPSVRPPEYPAEFLAIARSRSE
ncbi:MAG: glutathione S-transferase N-terminal domain-containing protein [Deltaproteobacteria bacterium]|nr:glutathione S-transferase N-terminal domain-containing protein [Deltaproteobacteria bacterium]